MSVRMLFCAIELETRHMEIPQKKKVLQQLKGWWCGAMVLGKLPVQMRPTIWIMTHERAYCACGRCGWGLFRDFHSHLSFLSSLSLFGRRPDIDWNTVSKGRQTQNQPTNSCCRYDLLCNLTKYHQITSNYYWVTDPAQCYKIFMFNSAEHEILDAHNFYKYQQILHFHA